MPGSSAGHAQLQEYKRKVKGRCLPRQEGGAQSVAPASIDSSFASIVTEARVAIVEMLNAEEAEPAAPGFNINKGLQDAEGARGSKAGLASYLPAP